MRLPLLPKRYLNNIAAHLVNLGFLTGLATLTFGLISCGGGGDSATTGSASTTPTITSITPAGMVASSVPKTLSLLGSNFVNGMTLSISNSSGVPYTITASSVTSATVMTATVTIPTAPADNYVNFAIKSSAGATLASAVLGVASSVQTAVSIQPILNANCTGCHTGATAGGLNLTDMTIGNSSGTIGITSSGCAPRFRVTPGDPRRSSSVLMDKIKATSGSAACAGAPMPNGAAQLSAADIQAIVDWVAGGAN